MFCINNKIKRGNYYVWNPNMPEGKKNINILFISNEPGNEYHFQL